MMEIYFGIIAIGSLIILGSFTYAGVKAAPWVPAKSKDLQRIIRAINLKDGEKFVELGAGDGRVLIELAKNQGKNQRLVGLDLSVLPYLLSQWKIWRAGLGSRIRYCYKDFFKYSLNDADVVYCFLLPRAMPKVHAKCQKELKKGARLVSYAFKVEGKSPESIDRPDSKHLPIWTYRY